MNKLREIHLKSTKAKALKFLREGKDEGVYFQRLREYLSTAYEYEKGEYDVNFSLLKLVKPTLESIRKELKEVEALEPDYCKNEFGIPTAEMPEDFAMSYC